MPDDQRPAIEFPHLDLQPPRPAARDRDGQPIDLAALELMWEHPQNRVVAFTSLTDADGVRQAVSTIWLGIDHAFEGEPLVYETAVFDGAGLVQRARHPDEIAALTGHVEALLQLISRGTLPMTAAERIVTDAIPVVAPDHLPASPDPEPPAPAPAPDVDLDQIAEDLEAAARARTGSTPIQEGTPDDRENDR